MKNHIDSLDTKHSVKPIYKTLRTYSTILLGAILVNACTPKANSGTDSGGDIQLIQDGKIDILPQKSSLSNNDIKNTNEKQKNAISTEKIIQIESSNNEINSKSPHEEIITGENKNIENSQNIIKKHKIALTFDDGPSPYTTPELLKILKEFNVKATFFMVGEMVDRNCSIAKQIVAEGHEVGSHSQSHKNLHTHNINTIEREVSMGHNALVQCTQKQSKIFRPPYGAMGKPLKTLLADKNLINVMWDIDSLDWKYSKKCKSAEKCVALRTQIHDNVMTHLPKKESAIVLLHDIHKNTIHSVARIIKDLKAKGYEFVTVSELQESKNTTAAVIEMPKSRQE